MPDIDQTNNPAETPEGRPGEDVTAAGRARRPGHTDETYDPSTVEVNRGRLQGLGVGQKDLDYQRDPTEAASAEEYGRADDEGRTFDPGRRTDRPGREQSGEGDG